MTGTPRKICTARPCLHTEEPQLIIGADNAGLGRILPTDFENKSRISSGRLVNDFGFFIRARRGNVIDQSLHLDEEGTTNDDGPAVKEARKRKFGEVG